MTDELVQREGAGEGEELDVEARLSRLEEIVVALEADRVGLEEALALFEEGIGHVRALERVLASAELRVRELLGEGEEGGLRTEEFEPEGGGEEPV